MWGWRCLTVEVAKLKADAVFEGGGVKGTGLVGALAYAESLGYRWQNVAGTSAGAIVAALVAAGYTAAEMKQIMDDLDYQAFLDKGAVDRIPVVGPWISVLLEKGLYEGRFFEDWLRGLLQAKVGVEDPTFGDLTTGDPDPRYRYKLQVIASDISLGRMLKLPHDIAEYGLDPDRLSVARAVRMSMSIPFFFEPAVLQHRRGKSYIVDGGLLSNFPVWIFDAPAGVAPEWPTFGFKLVDPGSGQPRSIRGPLTMLTALFATMMEAHDERYIRTSHFVRTIGIPTLGVATTDFGLSSERRRALYESGYNAARDFFERWNFAEYIERYRSGKPEISRREQAMGA